MKRGMLVLAIAVLAAIGSACGDDDGLINGGEETPRVTRTPTKTPEIDRTPEPTATMATATTPAQAELPPEAELPDEYPVDIAPIPEGAHLTSTEIRTPVEDGDDRLIYVDYLMNDSPRSVVDFYEEAMRGDGWSRVERASSGGGFRLEYENASVDTSVTVWVDPSDDYEGYTEVTLHIHSTRP